MSTPFHDLDDYVDLPRISGLALSPDGRRLVTSVATLSDDATRYTSALWELDPTGAAPARRLTHGLKGESAPSFAASGDLLFTSVRPATEDEEDSRTKVWCLPAAGGEAYEYASLPGGVSSAIPARASPELFVTGNVHPAAGNTSDDELIRAARKKNKVDAILHTGYPIRFWDADLGPDYPRLFVKAGADAELICLTPAAGASFTNTSAAISPDGSRVVASKTVFGGKGDQRSVLVAIDVACATETVIFDEEESGSPAISPDSGWVAFIQETVPDPHTAPNVFLWVCRPDGTEARNLTAEWDLWPGSIEWLADSSGMLVTADADGRGPIFHVTLAGVVRQVTDVDAVFTNVVAGPDGISAYALQSSYDFAPEVVRVDLASGEVTRLANPSERAALPGRLIDIATTATDGARIRSWLCLPEGAAADNPAPMLLWIHGGPLGSWNGWSWRWNPWLLVAQGYAVLLPDPALSTGYGQDFIQRGWGQWGQAPFTDLMAATDAAEALPEIDPTRTAAMGGSFGGYMANWVAGQTDRFDAIVTHASLWNLNTFGPTTDASFYWAREMTEEMIAQNSPHAHVSKIVSPMLVIHGDKDYRVPIGEGLALWYQLLAESGLPADADGTTDHRFLYFPNENHWILSPQHAKVWYQTVSGFLAEHVLGGSAAPGPGFLGNAGSEVPAADKSGTEKSGTDQAGADKA